MKKLLLLCLSLAWMGCQQPDPISVPKPKPDPEKNGTIVSATVDIPFDSALVNQPLQIIPKLITEGVIDTSLLHFDWKVTANGQPVDLRGLSKEKLLAWIPTLPGKYVAQVTITYGDKTLVVVAVLIITPPADNNQGALLAKVRKGMNGAWRGVVTTPWVDPYMVDVVFRADGSYSAYNLNPDNHLPALYYGTDEDSPLKTFKLDDLKANGEASGELTVLFHVGTTTVDEIRHVSLGPDGNTLSLEMWHFGTYGPVRLDLTREGAVVP